MKLLTLQYQRNGICGEGFYAATVQNLADTKGKFLITFAPKGGKDEIDTPSCRCVMLEGRDNPFYECWSGDNISIDLARVLNELKEKFDTYSKFKEYYRSK